MDKLNITRKLNFVFGNLTNILPHTFRKEFEEKAYIAGGCFYSLVNDLPVNDYDFFVTDKDFANRLKDYFNEIIDKDKQDGINVTLYKGLRVRVTKYAISLGDKFQIVVKYTGEPQEVCNEFDFLHNKFAFKDGKILEFAEWRYLKTNKIQFNKDRARDLCGVIQRIPKMIKKGFTISKSDISDMLLSLSVNGFDEREMEIIENKSTYN